MDQNVQNSAQDVPADQPVEAVVKKHILERRPKTPLEKVVGPIWKWVGVAVIVLMLVTYVPWFSLVFVN